MNLNELHSAYEDFFGPPNYVLELSAKGEDISPQKLDVVYDFPKPSEGKPETTLTTLGLAMHKMEEPCQTAELIMNVIGQQSKEDYNQLGQALAQLVWDRLQHDQGFAPDTVLPNVTFPFFNKMDHLFILDWGHTEPEWLYDIEPEVRLLEIAPIYEDEAVQLLKIDESIRRTIFVQAGGAWADPERAPVRLLENATKAAWHRLERWYNDKATPVYKQLKDGASEEEINELQNKLCMKLPDDLVASLRIHNGAVEFYDSYQYLTTDRVFRIWSMMNEINQQGAFSTYDPKESTRGIIQYTWWDQGWIPFAEDSEGNLICIDLNPDQNGKYCQVVYWEKVEGPLTSNYVSFFDWLWKYQTALRRGAYVFLEEHGICDKSSL